MARISGKTVKSFAPEGQLAIDVYQNNEEIIILAPIAGTTLKQLNVSVTDEVLTVSGKRKFPLKKSEEESYLTKECFWGAFSRAVVLPTNVDSTKITASFTNSVLEIRIPKTENVRTKVIPIKRK